MCINLPDVDVDLIAVEIAVRDVLRPLRFANIAFKLRVIISTLDNLVADVVVSFSSFCGNVNFSMSSFVVSTVPFFLISVCTVVIDVWIKVWITVVKNVF